MRKPKICFSSLNLPLILRKGSDSIGGAQLQTHLLAEEMVRRGYDVSVVTFQYNPDEIEEKPSYRMVPTCASNKGLPGFHVFYPKMYAIWKALHSIDADIYMTNSVGFIVGLLAAFTRRHKKKFLFFASSDSNFVPESRNVNMRLKNFYYWGIRRADAFAVHNPYQEETLRENFGKESTTIPNAFHRSGSVSSFDGSVLWVANIRSVKRPESFVELARRIPEEKFTLVGGIPDHYGGEDRALHEKVISAGKELPNLELTGALPLMEVEKLFERAKLFVNTSEVEAIPTMTFLQAWSRGIPVLCFHNPNNSISTNGLGASVDDIEGMTEKIRHLAQGKIHFPPEHIQKYYDQHYSIESAVDKYESLFDSLLK